MHVGNWGTYGDLDHVGSNEVETIQASQDSPQLARGPASRLGSSCGGRNCECSQSTRKQAALPPTTRKGKKKKILTSRVQRVNVQAQIHGVLGAHTVTNLLDNAVDANRVHLTRLDNLEPAVAIVLIVGGAAEGRADAGVDVGVVAEETLLGGVIKVRAVVDAGDLGGRTSKDFGTPCDFLEKGERRGWP